MGWQPTKVEITKSGDIGYTRGTYEMTVNDAKGNPHTDRASIFRSGATDGAWKCIVDTFNSDLPAVPSK